MKFPNIVDFLLSNYFTLYYYQKITDQYRIYYDRDKFRRTFQYLHLGYSLRQYRALYPQDLAIKRTLPYPVNINNRPLHHQILTYFFLFYACRCLAISLFSSLTDTVEKRILLGVELYGKDFWYVETSFFFWSSIGYLFLRYAFSTSPLDYKFLALNRVSEQNENFLYPSLFGLSATDCRKFTQFRTFLISVYHCIMFVFTFFGSICISYMYIVHQPYNLYLTNPIASIFWTLVADLWIYITCSVLFGNLLAFMVIARYINLKQKRLAISIRRSFLQLKSSKFTPYNSGIWQNFIILNVRYTHLQDEIGDYNRFWSYYLTFIFCFFILIISYILYILIFSEIVVFLKILYLYGLFNHLALLSGIIYNCGSVVLSNSKLSISFANFLAQYARSRKGLGLTQTLKLPNMNSYMTLSANSGFVLLNGYLLTFDTFRLLIINTSIYFILFIKN